MGNLWRCCARTCEAIELPFGVMSGVDPRNGVLDWGPDRRGKGAVLRILMPIGYYVVF